MKKIITAAFAVLFTFAAGQSSAQTIKLGTLAPKGSPWGKALQDLATSWSEESAGKVRVRIFSGGVAGDEIDMVRKIRIGQLHAAALTGAGLTKIAQEVQALQMPMMLRSDGELDFVREHVSDRLETALEAKGFKVLNWVDAGWVYFFTQNPVVRPADLKGQKLFAWVGETAHIEAWRDAGYQPVPLPATEIHTALSSGLITAVPTTPVAALAFQWFGLAKHMTDVKWAPLVGATVISTKAWDRIPEDLRSRLGESARKIGGHAQSTIRELGPKAVEVMKTHGLEVHSVPPGVVASWEAGARQGYPKLISKIVPAELVAEVERLRDEYRASLKAQ